MAVIAIRLLVGENLRLGKGEDSSGGREKESILADTVEALIGAVYTDSDWPTAQKIVLDLTSKSIADGAVDPGGQDYKTQLQEMVARLGLGVPAYELSGSGPDHDKSFVAKIIIDGKTWGTGQGRSKKRAEQAAAQVATTDLASNSLIESSEESS